MARGRAARGGHKPTVSTTRLIRNKESSMLATLLGPAYAPLGRWPRCSGGAYISTRGPGPALGRVCKVV
jgi:hypothetical protein